MAAPIRLVAIASESLRAYPLVKDQTTIGSAPDNDVAIDHKSVSRRHAVIVRRLGGFAVRDLDSTNGTRINGRRAPGTRRIRPGDELEFGSVRFAVMNSPRRGHALGLRGTAVALAILMAAGFALARYLAIHPLSGPSAPAPSSAANGGAEHPPVRAADSEDASAPMAEERHAAAEPEVSPHGNREWLTRINNYRVMAGLAAVREDPALSTGGFAHSRYLVKNSGPLIKAGTLGAELHNEEPGRPWYSAEGLRAARSGDVEQWWGSIPGSRPPPGWAIDEWFASTWHRMAILNPRLHKVGYGEYCENGACAAVLDVLSGLEAGGFAPASAPAAVQFPPQGATVHIKALGAEWPDPLTSCPGYTLPAGLPITLQLGAMLPARLSAYSLRRDSASEILEACGFDAHSYSNPGGPDQARARDTLTDLGAVVVVPRQPLTPGDYTVEMTVNGHSYDWRFSVKDAG